MEKYNDEGLIDRNRLIHSLCNLGNIEVSKEAVPALDTLVKMILDAISDQPEVKAVPISMLKRYLHSNCALVSDEDNSVTIPEEQFWEKQMNGLYLTFKKGWEPLNEEAAAEGGL